jgi:ribosomal protein L19
MSFGHGVEVFPILKVIDKVRVSVPDVRRAKLYYIRDLRGKLHGSKSRLH